MRPRVAAVLSIAGVLTAGSAAALVNARILDGGERRLEPTESSLIVETTTGSVPADSGPTLDPADASTSTSALPTSTSAATATSATTVTPVPVSLVPATSAVASSPPATAGSAGPVPTSTPASISSAPDTAPATAAPPPSTTATSRATYQLAGAGTVTLEVNGDSLTIINVSPAPGWLVKDAENQSVNSVRVRVETDGDSGHDAEVRFEASVVFGVVNTSLETN